MAVFSSRSREPYQHCNKISKVHYVIQGSFDGLLFVFKIKSEGSFWYQIYNSKSIRSQVTGLNVQQSRGKSRPILTQAEHKFALYFGYYGN